MQKPNVNWQIAQVEPTLADIAPRFDASVGATEVA
jgi:hypothetical protein